MLPHTIRLICPQEELLTAGQNRICRSENKDPFRVQEKEISAGDSPDGYAILILSAAGREDFHLLKEKSLWRHALP